MNFLAPAMLGFLGLLPVIVLLYFLKLKRRDEMISSTYLWRQAIEDLRVNSPFQRLRKNLLLWLQLALLALLIFGLTRPALDVRAGRGKRHICLIDTSASMGAKDVRPSRLEAAKGEAVRLVADMSRDDRMMLMTFDARPSVRVPFTKDKGRLREAIRGIRSRDAGTDFGQAVDLVRALAQDVPDVLLYVLSDGGFEREASGQDPAVAMQYVKFGRDCRNVGITALDARRSIEDWSQPQVFARVENAGPGPANVRVELHLKGRLFDARALTVPPGESAAAVFSDAHLREGLVRVALTPDDDMAADNQAWLALAEPRPVRTLVVTAGNYFLELAVQGDPLCSPVFMKPEEFDAELNAGTPGEYDMTILDRHAPPSLPAGSYLFLGALPPLEAFRFEGEADNPVVIDWDAVHPVNRYVNYANLFLAKAMRVVAPGDAHTLVEADAGPLIVWWRSPRYRLVVVGFDLYASRWPLRVGFPVFLANVVRYLGGAEMAGQAARVRPGTAITFAAPPGTARARVTCPDGHTEPVAVQSGRITFGETYACGPYVFDFEEGGQKTYVVNLLDSRESNIAPRDTVPWRKATVAGAARALKENREIWFWFALAALAVLMAEWYIYNRRVYV